MNFEGARMSLLLRTSTVIIVPQKRQKAHFHCARTIQVMNSVRLWTPNGVKIIHLMNILESQLWYEVNTATRLKV
jgi:hypothetical protein